MKTYYTRCSCGMLVDERLPGGSKYYYLFDGQGSVVGLTDSSGSEVNAYDYDPYGVILNTASNSVANPFQYEAGYFESSTGLVKFGTRYYNPNLGRWTQQDPVPGSLGNPDALNRYLYAGDNPVNEADPSGAATGNCGTSFVDVTSGTLPGFADIYFSLDSSLGSIVFFSLTITLIGGSLAPFTTLVVVRAPTTGAFYDEIIPAVPTGFGLVVAILSGFAVLANGTTCAIYDAGADVI